VAAPDGKRGLIVSSPVHLFANNRLTWSVD